ncbi:hypothetical protein PFLUV_G00073090 [Perca fluviatilis]|uniref:Uncharacterized protein n=1 Tax=Perca fluviatilis TaxID=8168 RepID=A0A6A5FEL9_PERFL|nr:hypothetical protein PFLUV_G00073090 [Perca fluviatilis]
MWTEVKNKSKTVIGNGNSSEMGDPDLTRQLLHTVQQRNGSTAAATHPALTEDSLTSSSGIIPGAIAATVFIAFLLALYAVLWKCMVSPPPQRKHSKLYWLLVLPLTQSSMFGRFLGEIPKAARVFRTNGQSPLLRVFGQHLLWRSEMDFIFYLSSVVFFEIHTLLRLL